MRLAITFLTLAVPVAAGAVDLPPNDGFVTDTARILTVEQERDLERSLDAYQQSTSNEIAIVILPSLSGAVLEDTALELLRTWGVGNRERNNGIVVLVSYQDRSVTISVGYGLEGAVPDIVAYGIIKKDIVPAFKEGNYFDGLTKAVDSLEKHIGGEYTAERYDEEDTPGFSAWAFFLLFILIDWAGAFLARSKSWWMGGVLGGIFGTILTALYSWWFTIPFLVLLGLFFDYIVSKKGWRRSRSHGGIFPPFGGGSGGGGGFRGFGGGSGGGGGASGRW